MFTLFHPETNIIKFQCPEINIATASFRQLFELFDTCKLLLVSFDHSLGKKPKSLG